MMTKHWQLRFYGLILVAGLLLFSRLGASSVFQVAEARNAECSREMLNGNNWVVPYFNGILRTDKPALQYFAMMLAYRFAGVSEGAARFFSAVCGLLVYIGTFLLVLKMKGLKAACWSGVVLLSSVHMILQFRLATPDPYLIMCHCLGLYCFIYAWVTQKHSWYLAMYVFLGLAILAKGPVGLLLPALSILVFLVWRRKFTWSVLLKLRPFIGLPIMLGISLPWYWMVHIQTNGAWTKGFFLYHNLNRFEGAMDQHGGIFLLTIVFVLAGMFPFSLFVVRALKKTWSARSDDFTLFTGISFLTIIVFYCFSKTRLFNYTTPSYPFLAILTGCYLSSAFSGGMPRITWKPELLLNLLISSAIPAALYLWMEKTAPLQDIAWTGWLFLLLPFMAVFTLVLVRKHREHAIWLLGISYMAATLLIFLWVFPLMDQQTPMRKRQSLVRNAQVVAYRQFNDAFVFYVGAPIPVITERNALDQYLRHHPTTLVISRGKIFDYLDSLSSLHKISEDRELFSRQSSVIYGNSNK